MVNTSEEANTDRASLNHSLIARFIPVSEDTQSNWQKTSVAIKLKIPADEQPRRCESGRNIYKADGDLDISRYQPKVVNVPRHPRN